ncbi:MAG TPA: sterol desaturase family protein [Sphingorhabdus sp.]|jgi:sterol desaturase/sphingolipid hydroxylase (fatty acid hydroxylase superfamily)|uniref:sterol desaturase family protein n=1 Tax=Sphingorhabdus sp. TaxID=1902408 RepID=UPI002C003096|nr:sterol desaturase family protein [Sphingorhabdus sp.]HMT40232.1 sterol desaturase family protein [Sphingorhabdus sp.]HMU23388.1 sterol desaturase family protein [Sphingorhabdus sp.]
MGDMGATLIAILPALVFALIAILEFIRPRRTLRFGRFRRWTTGLILFASNRVTVWLIAWIIAVPAIALWAEAEGIGLFNQLAAPLWAEILGAFLLLDFAMWLQHLLTHKMPLLWRLHKVHHADPDIDVSTAIRFHPGEIAFSILWKAGWVLLLGVSAPVIIAFEAWLAANAAFNHGNVALPRRLDRLVRLFLVTPDMHLVHHSTALKEQQSNYGFALTIWDQLFGTYRAESEKGRNNQPIGLSEMQDERPTYAGFSLKLPLT